MRENGSAEVGAAFDALLRSLITEHQPQHLIFEAPYLPSGNRRGAPFNPETLLSAGGYKRQIEVICWQMGVFCWQQDGRAAVKALTGRGGFTGKTYEERRHEKKRATMQACWVRGWRATEDECDALALLMLAETKLYPEAAITRQRVLRPIKGPLFQCDTPMK